MARGMKISRAVFSALFGGPERPVHGSDRSAYGLNIRLLRPFVRSHRARIHTLSHTPTRAEMGRAPRDATIGKYYKCTWRKSRVLRLGTRLGRKGTRLGPRALFLLARAVFLLARYTTREPCTAIGIQMKTIFSVHGSQAVCYFLIEIKALPTPLAMSIIHAANKLRYTFKRTIASQAMLALFRASLPLCVKFAFSVALKPVCVAKLAT
jgi:hypothetical protein